MRLIDADALKNPYAGTSLDWEWMVLSRIIADAPTVGPRWIPVTEQMPDSDDEVLVTVIVDCGNKKKRCVETSGWFNDGHGGGEWSSVWDEYRVAGERIEVIAWMPLPKPWEGER